MLVKYELCLWQVCLEDQGGVSSSVYLQDIIMMKNEVKPKGFKTQLTVVETSYNSGYVLSNEVQGQDEHLEQIICLKLSILMVIMDI